MQLSGTLVDLHQRRLIPATLTIEDGRISAIEESMRSAARLDARYSMFASVEENSNNKHRASNRAADRIAPYLLPGFVDAHVHVESSLLAPVQFARLAVVHGTVATVSDPHEIANVLGVPGVEWMVENSRRVPFTFCFGAPSCVPATAFETAGAHISATDIDFLLTTYPEIGYLAEVMNFPGVLQHDPEVHAKLVVAQTLDRPIDGHAPGLRGEEARQYAAAGIQTDHECTTADEARDKLAAGMKVLIREGSAAKNFDALAELIPEHSDQLMLCSDDKHPDSLLEGHINQLVARAVARFPEHLFDILRMACVNPVEHYRLPVGLLRVGEPADFIVVDDLETFTVRQTYIRGELVAENGVSLIENLESEPVNEFNAPEKQPEDFAYPLPPEGGSSLRALEDPLQGAGGTLRVIEVLDGQLLTNELRVPARLEAGQVVPDLANDILKLTVVNRYSDAPPAVAFVKNVGLRTGALASSVAHDSHNIVAVGTSDEAICQAVNLVIAERGGLAAVGLGQQHVLPLPIAGLMSGDDGYDVARRYTALDRFVKEELGSSLGAPFMSLSFLALLVIPRLKLSDQGLFDGDSFAFTKLLVPA
jgi:adenine deaminase